MGGVTIILTRGMGELMYGLTLQLAPTINLHVKFERESRD